ncbi:MULTISPECIES: 3-phosphoserine/phosphohydroxythreonine transaminase [Burkholderia]|jgi:phosphoserine aminotransferase|uniref:Phosphoserine aminotransferase n=1 Tax=Burkholderia gladioli TaxID=28095 RepID=A0AAP1UNP7_BURGA|nr:MULTISPECIES: 3-phosphoserine/phosphohydroxythreonine transaminase [Burkholderia]AJW97805.1 phosphoserine aminotransferase [Burkholderia gladioli]ASD78391.1 3-phosphoserine/phosphohydroxythreonine aminotransferase [Burkholderia gladioli pv. gladioli]AWY56362.1 3-phosphoserine/phosphohydroxythreonine aminotransferase [Burkholderia gladioli pv. gladioli]AYQ87622.1 3-phosphoserine/phosphohydroxythreonine transaminase [Burkholderia gladioli]KAF1064515.1 Phosphoserine aminotransferase [Burkholde
MRVFNFSAGPAAMPEDVLRQAADEMLDWNGSGMSVMEMSHRGREFTSIHETALADLRELLAVPDNYRVLFLQGGGIAENAIVPMNLLGTRQNVDFVVTGSWSQKSFKEAQKYGTSHLAATGRTEDGFTRVPAFSEWQMSADPAYVHLCTNETIDGVETFDIPDTGSVPLVADVSSHILSRPLDISRYGALFGGAQKNIGMAGVTLVIVREDLLERALPICPSAFEWKTVAANNSMYNTPPTYAIYIAGLVFKWLKAQGGLEAIEARNVEKAALLYDAIDASSFYLNKVEKNARSRMNVPFFLADETRNEDFLAGAKARGLLQLKGHKSVGGMRASIYNAVPLAGVKALVEYMKDFERGQA